MVKRICVFVCSLFFTFAFAKPLYANTDGLLYIIISYYDENDYFINSFWQTPGLNEYEYQTEIPEHTSCFIVDCLPNSSDVAMQLYLNGSTYNFLEKYYIGSSTKIPVVIELFQNFDHDVYTINITKSSSVPPAQPSTEPPSTDGDNSGGGSGGSSRYNASITPSRFTFDKKTNEDIIVTLSSEGYNLRGVKNGSYTLVKGTDYTVNGNKYTVKAAYLATLAIGEQTVIFDMSGGSDPKLTITVEDTTQETAEPSPNPAPTSIPIEWQNPFADVKSSDWFYGAVEYVFTNDLMMGTSTDPLLFSPSATVTRGMVVTVLYRAAGSPDVTGRTNPFNDVAEDKYYTNAVIWAAANGIVSGYEDGRYGPEDNITREQLTAILNNYSESAGIILPVTREYVSFSDDADIAIYAKEAIEQFFKSGIINGKSGNLFDPKGSATRAELATMLKGLLKGII